MKTNNIAMQFLQHVGQKTLLQATQNFKRQWYPRLNNPTLSQHNISNKIETYSCIPGNHHNPYSSHTITSIVCRHPRLQENDSDRGRNHNPEAYWKASTLSHFLTAGVSCTWKHQLNLQQSHLEKRSSLSQ